MTPASRHIVVWAALLASAFLSVFLFGFAITHEGSAGVAFAAPCDWWAGECPTPRPIPTPGPGEPDPCALPGRKDDIPEGLICGAVTSDVLLHAWEDEAGNRVELFCSDRAPFLDEFSLQITYAGGEVLRIGRCPWDGGQNEGHVIHTGDSDGDGKVNCLLRTFWRSVEPDVAQGEPITQDWKEYIFDVKSRRLTLKHFTSEDGVGGRFADRLVKQAFGIDPRSFNPEPSGDTPMVTARFDPCDVDRDGDCDAEDHELAEAAMGASQTGDGYNAVADADHDGMVTADDVTILFPPSVGEIVRYPDMVSDSSADGGVSDNQLLLNIAAISVGCIALICGAGYLLRRLSRLGRD